MEKRPLLSVAMIFRDDIRCLERCLRSLEPLRQAVPCQVVMADTGSADGSRAIAERYADTVFDFPWIDDFAAARNAVLDRCAGDWCLTLDSDEWLDADISQLVNFLKDWDGDPYRMGMVVIRNYTTCDFNGPYQDFLTNRLVCMAKRPRYEGAIHEQWAWPGRGGVCTLLRQTVLHHDGYVEMGLDSEAGREKRARNMALLRKKLEEAPDNLQVYLQMLESGREEPDYPDILRRAVELVEKRAPHWETLGPPILRYAVTDAAVGDLPELEEWIQKAEAWFPDSAFTRIDVAFQAFLHFRRRKRLEEAVRRGEGYLEALAEDRAGRLDPLARLRSALQADSPLSEQALKISLADVYRNLERPEEARALLEGLDFSALDSGMTETLAQALMNLRTSADLETDTLVTAAWAGLSAPVPDERAAGERTEAFCGAVFPAFGKQKRAAEREAGLPRHAYTLLLPLCGKCEPGTAAAMLETEDAARLEALLAMVEDWTLLPPEALDHALRRGARFPLPGKPMDVETMDLLAARLAVCGDCADLLPEDVEDAQTLCWVRGLALAAVRECKWEDAGRGMELARQFAEVERAFLPLCYAGEALTEEGLFLLPPMHRFGWHCARAFAALDEGDAAGYVRLLRAGLETAPEMKPMVEFLTEHTPELQAPPPSPELLALAERVRTMLAAYDPEDPAVQAIKASPVYQRVAYLIEGT